MCISMRTEVVHRIESGWLDGWGSFYDISRPSVVFGFFFCCWGAKTSIWALKTRAVTCEVFCAIREQTDGFTCAKPMEDKSGFLQCSARW